MIFPASPTWFWFTFFVSVHLVNSFRFIFILITHGIVIRVIPFSFLFMDCGILFIWWGQDRVIVSGVKS